MQEDGSQKWVFVAKHEGAFYPEGITTLENLDNLEYADVRDGQYQLWSWPSGDIYEIAPDREVEPDKEYSVPYDNNGTVWLPTLKKIGEDKSKVNDALNQLSK